MLAVTVAPGGIVPLADVTEPKKRADGTADGPPALLAGVGVPVWAKIAPPPERASAPASATDPASAENASILLRNRMQSFPAQTLPAVRARPALTDLARKRGRGHTPRLCGV